MEYIESKITLENIRPYLSSIYGSFGVPFNDYGFLMSKDEIEKSSKEFDEKFKKATAMILGITPEEAAKKMKKKKQGGLSKPYNWCWRNNYSYSINLNPNVRFPISISISDDKRTIHNISIHYNGYVRDLGYFVLTEDGIVMQQTKRDINSLEDIFAILRECEDGKLIEEIKKLKATEKRTLKSLETTRNKIKNLEDELHNRMG